MSGAGRGLLGAAVVLYVSGVALGWPELLVPAVAAGLAVAVAVVWVLRRPSIALERRIQPDRVTVGGRAHALVSVRNLSRRRSAPFTTTDRVGEGDVVVPVPAVPGRGTVRVPYDVPTSRRGRIRLGPVTVTRSDLLGLCRNHQSYASHRTLWIHPRTHRLRPFPTGITLDLEGPLVETAPRGAITFSTLREYVPGDDVRQIHWRSTARTGTLMVREHVDTSQPRTTVALDVRAQVWTTESFEHGVEAAASLASAAERDGHPVVLIVGDHGRHVAADGDEPSHILDRLSLVEVALEGGNRLFDVLDRADGGGVLAVISGGRETATTARLAALRRRFSLVVAVHVAPGVYPRIERRAGLVVIDAASGRQFADLWNRLVG